jgi:predicted Rossmann fold flavoprotein
MDAPSWDLITVGGGAAGYFGAITAAETAAAQGRRLRVLLLEASPAPLAKVRISGGGRCNVTHHCFEPAELITRYPRGSRELRGPFSRFGPRDTIAWFANRGVRLKTESDGRMFPVTDRSSTIIAALESAAQDAGVKVRTRAPVEAVTQEAGGFIVRLASGESLRTARVLLATGGMKATAPLIRLLGHTLEEPVPSLFSFHCRDPRLRDLAGLSLQDAAVSVPGVRPALASRGPLLFTHEGLSGPAILRLSAWGARALAGKGYSFELTLSLLPDQSPAELLARLAARKLTHGRKALHTECPFDLPLRLWEKLTSAAGAQPETTWASASKPMLESLAGLLADCRLRVTGKSLNKDEFVTCGGVSLREVDFRTMESRRVPGLHFAGEVLDIDGITGGFNFQAAWTTGWHAGSAIATVLAARG